VDHPPVRPARIGVLLVNLGTPDGTGYWPMRRYLGQFLSDRRVVETNPLVWQPILNLVVLTTRPRKSGKLYAEIWNREKDESPLKTITRDQAEAVAGLLRDRHGDRIVVDWAMRYGSPSTESRLKALADQGCERVLLFPLYPQYSATTTATACDDAFRALMRMRRQPALRVVPHYHDDPAYIDAVARSIRERLGGLERQPEVVVASFHGLPKEFLLKGDPYHCYCIKTARLVRERLGWPESRLKVTFQSRFGPEEWLKPYTDETVVELARSGVKRMAIVAPGFSADCLETLEELDVQMRDLFLGNGGEEFTYVPCLNAADDHVRMLAGIAERELSGWV
jgi:ferrochelatase